MIETVMFFALGFLVASLCALLVLPAINARAARLARRRIDGMFPLSVAEIAAEKDYLRARFAVTQRRLERKVEAARNSRHADMAAIGVRTLENAAMARTVEEREAALAVVRTTLGGVEHDLETARAEGAAGAATLQVLEEAHRTLLDDLIALRDVPPAVAGDAPDQAAEPDLAVRHAILVAERETLRASLAAAEAALAETASAETALAGQGGMTGDDTADLRKRITEVADALLRREHLPSVDAFPITPASTPRS